MANQMKEIVETGEYLTTIEFDEIKQCRVLIRRERRENGLEYPLDRDYVEVEGVPYVRANSNNQCFKVYLADGEDWKHLLRHAKLQR